MKNIDRVIKGLKIIKKYSNNICAEHDVIYAGKEEKISKEDENKLDELGWFKGHFGYQIFV